MIIAIAITIVIITFYLYSVLDIDHIHIYFAILHILLVYNLIVVLFHNCNFILYHGS